MHASCMKISAKADEQWSVSQKCNLAKIDGRSTIYSTGRPNIWPVETKHSRWPQAMAGEVWGWSYKLLPTLRSKTTSVWCKTRHKTIESRDPKAGRVAETSGNSRRTRTRMITECSNGDVQVLRTVKNGVSTPGNEYK